jgi:hypothetical protein
MQVGFASGSKTSDNEDMKRFPLLLTALFALASVAFADKPAASELMAKAQAQAQAQKKSIFVSFDASW